MEKFVSAYDFQESFTMEVASALIEGLGPRFHPKGLPQIVQRMRDDAGRGLLTVVDGVIARDEIARWIAASGLGSEYSFGSPPDHGGQSIKGAIDLSNLPVELRAATMAHRALLDGYGDQSATPRTRLIAYLKEHYPAFKQEQKQRIATVANPDKTTGRKKNIKE
jgi:hypothetical protein